MIAYKKKTLIGVNSYSNTLETPNPGTLNTSISYSPYYPAQCLSENAADTIPSVAVLRESIEFEKIRCKLEDFVGKSGKRPVIQLLPLGDKRMRQARASFAYNFLNCGGYDVRSHNGFDSFDNALDFVNEWNPDAVVFCSSDAEYGELTSFWKSKAAILKNIPLVLLAGNPGELSETYKNNGVSLFIHLKSNLVETLSALHQHFGIKL